MNSLPQWKPLIFAVAFLYATVQERRKYGPLGWNIPYEFNATDLSASLQFIHRHLDDTDIHRGVDWNCVRYMLGQIQFGGRVTDEFDKRLLVTYCEKWFGEWLFDPEFTMAPDVCLPSSGDNLQGIVDWIEQLPVADSPKLFGMHENASIVYQSKTAQNILDRILEIQPKEASSGVGETREDCVYRMGQDMLTKLPADYVPFEVTERLNRMGVFEPLTIFLRQEVDRMQRLLSNVRKMLIDLKLAIDGTIVMSENLRELLDYLYDAKIPPLWSKLSWDSSTIGFWFTELIERNKQFSDWLQNGRPNCFWITGFFNPQGFLTAIRQETARAHKGWALDAVALWNEVTKQKKDEITKPPPEGAYIYGLYLEGAALNRRKLHLTDAKPKVLYDPMPVMHVLAIDVSGDQQLPAELLRNSYVCPVYKKPQRTDQTYVTNFYLRCPPSKPPEHWILRGTAMLCDIR